MYRTSTEINTWQFICVTFATTPFNTLSFYLCVPRLRDLDSCLSVNTAIHG